MSGPMPKPTALKKLEGTDRPDRTNPREPKPQLGAAPPDHLQGEARDTFYMLAHEFNAAKILTVLDSPALTMLCEIYADYRELKDIVARDGYLVDHVATGGFTVKKLNPVAPQLNKVRDQLLTLLRDFGATPASRTKVHTVEGTDEVDPLDEYMSRKGV